MEQLKKQGHYQFNDKFADFISYSTDEEATLQTIKFVYDKYKYLIDPHTAVAYNAYLNYIKETNSKVKTVILSTASVFKFPQSVLQAFGYENIDAMEAIKIISSKFNLNIPKVLNYPSFEREVLSLDEAKDKIIGVIKCFM